MKRPLGIYVHIPFCERKCNYCDFLSFVSEPQIQRSYVERLLAEIGQAGEAGAAFAVETVFIGGGTPSVLPGEEIARILNKITETFVVRPAAEVTIEANPGMLTADKLSCYQQAGGSRISLGLQSTDNDELRELGRIHSYEAFLETYYMVREAGISNINVDLMTALPGQTAASYRKTLKKVAALNPEHISAYSLIIEPETPFYEKYKEDAKRREAGARPEFLPEEEEERQMYGETGKILREYAYHHYEISNYARENYECRHNIGYWRRKDYLGFGLGAASLINERRMTNGIDLGEYLAGKYRRIEDIQLSEKEQMEEFMFLGLRLMEGVQISVFEQLFRVTLNAVYGRQVEKLKNQKLLYIEGDYLRLTEKGRDLSNLVFTEFLIPS